MAVVSVEPPAFANAPVVAVFSDAADNFSAIREIDAWARQNGFLRAAENALGVTRRNGRVLYRGACYPALSSPEIAEAMRANAEAEKRRSGMPVTPSSVLLAQDVD